MRPQEINLDSCKRCGTCCLKGGPAFHREDRELLESGRVKLVDIYTIREGEPVYDNVRGYISQAETDIIKIKGLNGTWTCRFLDQATRECRIYRDRPLECRVMKCWDTRDIESLYERDRLTRHDLIFSVKGLWELIEDHQSQCSYHDLRNTIKEGFLTEKDEAILMEMIKYDLAIRPLMVEKGQLKVEMMDFLLGRPMLETASMLGLVFRRTGDSYRIELLEPQRNV